MTDNARPLVSIVTVCYNAACVLGQTIDSVRGQTYDRIEYVIVDGASTDGTTDIIRSNADIVTKWKSEPDEGLYFAMNKALDMICGDYVLFLNAGDIFHENTTLEKVFASAAEPQDIYYGDTMILSVDGTPVGSRRLSPPLRLTRRSFRWGMTVCHQSVVIRRELCGKYNTDYTIAADYDWVLSSIERSDAGKITNCGIFISNFRQGGISSRNFFKANRQRFVIMCRHYGLLPALWYNFLMLFRLFYTYLRKGRL